VFIPIIDRYGAATAFHSTLPQNVESSAAGDAAGTGSLGHAARRAGADPPLHRQA
jgi:hypothetical protein